MSSAISNPPYNMSYDAPAPLVGLCDPRFSEHGIPPKNNANLVFVLSALDAIDEKAAFVLPAGFLSAGGKEQEIRKSIVDANLIESVIILPNKMFESTDIPVCVVLFSKIKKTARVEMIDLRDKAETEIREQNGQYGGNSHTGRTYRKEVNVITDAGIDDVVSCIAESKNEAGYCKPVTLEDIRNNEYNLTPARYIDIPEDESNRRSYHDIVSDINRIIADKNCLKLTMNETIAKAIGIYDIWQGQKSGNDLDLNTLAGEVGEKVEKEDWIAMSKNKNEIKFENKSKEGISEILVMILQQWKAHVMYLNNRENVYLAELRDALIVDLMSGKVSIDDE